MEIVTKCKEIETANGTWQTIYPLGLLSAHKLAAAYNALIDRLKELEPDWTISDAIANDSLFLHLCSKCLSLCGLEPDQVSVPMIEVLLFPHDGKPTGELLAFNFPDKALAENKALEETENKLARLMASLWLATEDLEKTIASLDALTSNDFSKVMAERAYLQLSPEERERRRSFNKAKDIMEKRGLIING